MSADDDTTIQIAAGDGELDVVKAMVAAGVNVNDADTFGYTALHAAAGYAQAEVMEYLLSIGANVHAGDCDGDTPLHQAESVECAALLLKAGAVLDARNSKGQTPLYVAMKDDREDVAEYLKSVGAAPVEVPEGGFPDSDSDGDLDVAIKRMIALNQMAGEDPDDETEFPDVDGEGGGDDGDVDPAARE